MQKFLFRLLSVLAPASLVFSAGCVHYDVPHAVMHAPQAQIWGVGLLKSHSGHRVVSFTRMNGSAPLTEKPTVLIASGADGNWQWQVKAVPSVVPAWKAWWANKRMEQLRREAERSGNLVHSALTWNLAFVRAHRVVRYLLGHQPPALHATLQLVPDGVSYRRMVTRNGAHFFPLTLTFYWPNSKDASKGASALIYAVLHTVYEYQHLLVDSKIIAPVGKTKGNRTTNDEARSQCWFDSTVLVLQAGTPTTVEWNLSKSRAAMALLQQSTRYKLASGSTRKGSAPERSPKRIPYSYAVIWGRFFAIESIANYLQLRGVSNSTVVANNPAEMNAVLSVCRAMTRHPLDITVTDGYPPSKVRYAPFFPANLEGLQRKSASGGK